MKAKQNVTYAYNEIFKNKNEYNFDIYHNMDGLLKHYA